MKQNYLSQFLLIFLTTAFLAPEAMPVTKKNLKKKVQKLKNKLDNKDVKINELRNKNINPKGGLPKSNVIKIPSWNEIKRTTDTLTLEPYVSDPDKVEQAAFQEALGKIKTDYDSGQLFRDEGLTTSFKNKTQTTDESDDTEEEKSSSEQNFTTIDLSIGYENEITRLYLQELIDDTSPTEEEKREALLGSKDIETNSPWNLLVDEMIKKVEAMAYFRNQVAQTKTEFSNDKINLSNAKKKLETLIQEYYSTHPSVVVMVRRSRANATEDWAKMADEVASDFQAILGSEASDKGAEVRETEAREGFLQRKIKGIYQQMQTEINDWKKEMGLNEKETWEIATEKAENIHKGIEFFRDKMLLYKKMWVEARRSRSDAVQNFMKTKLLIESAGKI